MPKIDIDSLAQAFQECTLPKPQWTHQAHLIVGTWYVRNFGKLEARERMRAGIRRLNDAHGVPNSDARGYHETITCSYISLLDDFLSLLPNGTTIEEGCKRLICSRLTDKNLLFSFYSRDLLMSPRARKEYVEPDLAPVRLNPFQLIRAKDRIRRRWKNGGGWTEQIAIFPANATLESFEWRVSIAGTDQAGAFSLFPGMDRSLALLSGEVALSIDGNQPTDVNPLSPPISFSGDIPTLAAPILSPLIDLNVITRRGRFVHTMERCNLETLKALPLGSGVTLVISIATHDAQLFEQPSSSEVQPDQCEYSYIIRIEPV